MIIMYRIVGHFCGWGKKFVHWKTVIFMSINSLLALHCTACVMVSHTYIFMGEILCRPACHKNNKYFIPRKLPAIYTVFIVASVPGRLKCMVSIACVIVRMCLIHAHVIIYAQAGAHLDIAANGIW